MVLGWMLEKDSPYLTAVIRSAQQRPLANQALVIQRVLPSGSIETETLKLPPPTKAQLPTHRSVATQLHVPQV
jgi:hypothetical protein